MGYAYSPDALVYDSGTNTWSLRPDYDHTQHRVEIIINDDDAYLSGDFGADEVGSDSNQLGTVYDLDGNLIASGRIYDEYYYKLSGPSGETIYVERIEIAGEFVGWIVTQPLEPGASYTQIDSGDVYYDDETDTELRYSELASVPCFSAATLIATSEGAVPVSWLRAGDLVVTRDRGLQSVVWVGCTEISLNEARASAGVWPLRIEPGLLGRHDHNVPLVVSPWHRVLLRGPQIELHFGEPEVLVPAKHLLGWPGVESEMPTAPLLYYHLLLDRHEIVLADGQWVESLYLGDLVSEAMNPFVARRLQAFVGLGGGHRRLARPELKAWEAQMLQAPSLSRRPRQTLKQSSA